MTLVAGAVLLYAAVHLAKNGIDRPRPRAGSSMRPARRSRAATRPIRWSGSRVAVLFSRTLPGLARSAALITVSIVLAALIGLSRVYLRVHYWSDVAGGWGLGAGVLGGCAAVALIVAYIRNNEAPGRTRRRRPEPMTILAVTNTQLAIAVAAGIVGAGYLALILIPAVTSYGRLWERVAAGFLTLYILGVMLGAGGCSASCRLVVRPVRVSACR